MKGKALLVTPVILMIFMISIMLSESSEALTRPSGKFVSTSKDIPFYLEFPGSNAVTLINVSDDRQVSGTFWMDPATGWLVITVNGTDMEIGKFDGGDIIWVEGGSFIKVGSETYQLLQREGLIND